MFCTKCGQENTSEAKFCLKCGLEIVGIENKAGIKEVKINKPNQVFVIIISIVTLFVTVSAVKYLTQKGVQVSSNAYEKINSEWTEVAPLSGGFKALMPNKPEVENNEQKMPNSDKLIKQALYSSSVGGSYYTISAADYPITNEIPNMKDYLDRVVKGIVATDINYVLASNESMQFNGFTSTKYLIKNNSNEVYVKGILFMNGNRQYQIIYTYTSYNEADYNKFINSFQLTN